MDGSATYVLDVRRYHWSRSWYDASPYVTLPYSTEMNMVHGSLDERLTKSVEADWIPYW